MGSFPNIEAENHLESIPWDFLHTSLQTDPKNVFTQLATGTGIKA